MARYLEMRPVTVGLRIDDLFSRADGVVLPKGVRAQAQVLTLTRLADEVVCWGNDLVSLDKELRQGDVHNLVQVLRHAHGYSLQAAVAQANRRHDETLARYLETEQGVRAQFGGEPGVARYLELLRARMRGIHDWALASGRYRQH